MPTFGVFVLWLHLLAVVIWVGGLAAVSLACVPVLMRELRPPGQGARLAALVAGRFQRISWEIMSLIVVTGILKLVDGGAARGFDLGKTYIATLVAKAGLLAAVAGIQAWQSFRLIPAFAVTAPLDACMPEAARFRRRVLASSLISVALAALAIYLGLQLRYR